MPALPHHSATPTNDSFSLREGLRPVIILGAARSGTKFLTRVLRASRVCRAIPYGISHVWMTGHWDHPDDALPANHLTEQQQQQIRDTLVRLARVRRATSVQYLVEKTCANTLRVPLVHAVVPDASFLHIIRDGRDVTASAHRRWHTPPRLRYLLGKLRYVTPSTLPFAGWYLANLVRGRRQGRPVAIWGPRYPGMADDLAGRLPILEVCARQWATCVEATVRDLERLSIQRVLTIRYEELVRDPGVVDQLLDFLDVPDPDAVRAYYHQHVQRNTVGSWKQMLTDADMATIMPVLGPTLTRLGY